MQQVPFKQGKNVIVLRTKVKLLASLSLELPRVGRPRWTIYSESTTPTFFIRLPWNIVERWMRTTMEGSSMKWMCCCGASNLPVHNNQAAYRGPTHGLSHSVDKKMIRLTWLYKKKPCTTQLKDWTSPFVFFFKLF